ncbi:hypothetical protein HK101_005465 [Irineochytrium annulatum]|nr:hypothetical protein HK101_005465 [Irineochytrium annulatum]
MRAEQTFLRRVLAALMALALASATAASPVTTIPHPSQPAASSSVNVQLQSFTYDPATNALSGSIWVRNIAFAKTVRLGYSTPGGGSWGNFVTAAYQQSAAAPFETWTFSATPAGFGSDSQFYIQFTVNGANYYDNNNNANYLAPNAPSTVLPPPTSASPTPTPSSSTTAPSPTTGNIFVHREGPALSGSKVLLQSYQYDSGSHTLSGTIWVSTSLSNPTVTVTVSDTTGSFTSSSSFTIQAAFSSGSSFPGYNLYTFSGVNAGVGVGTEFYLSAAASGTTVYDSNGSGQLNYRIWPQRYVPSGWKGRSIYASMTDRFARSNGDTSACGNLNDYCGGTWNGMKDQLDYILDMGFDAILISPIVNNVAGGYHGYWSYDFATVNTHFGSVQDLQNLIAAAHDRHMYVMIDVVVNHVGTIANEPSGYPQQINTFDCFHTPFTCVIQDYNNQAEVENCRLNSVNPDLNTENAGVIEYLGQYAEWIKKTFNPDGLRMDSAKHVRKTFFADWLARAGNPFTVAEVLHGDNNYVAPYSSVFPSLFDYPNFYVLRQVFGNKTSMLGSNIGAGLIHQLQATSQLYRDPSVLVNFIDNQDQDRFLSSGVSGGDTALVKNALAFAVYTNGIPAVYQGTEQGFSDLGGVRRPLWDSKFSTLSFGDFYNWVSVLVRSRRDFGGDAFVGSGHQVLFTSANLHVFRRGPFVIAVTNVGTGGSVGPQAVNVGSDLNGRTMRNIFGPTDAITPNGAGTVTISLTNGQPKIYV